MSTKVESTPGQLPPATFSEYVTVGEAANLLGVSPWTLRNWDNNGKLKSLRHPKNGYRIYRREDLATLLQDEGLRGRLYDRLTPHLEWSQIGQSDHFVQFYASDSFLTQAASRFLGAALRSGDGTVLIATKAHRDAIQRRLRADGLDLQAARAEGRLVALDAAETLAKFMVAGSPDSKRFRKIVGGVLAQAGRGRPRVHAFGEMVALLCAEGNAEAAIRLEELWNDLRATHTFVLHCAYPIEAFGGEQHGRAFASVCACHSEVIPTESYVALASEGERLREIAQLQQKAQALNVEVARRKRLEAGLRAHRQYLPKALRELIGARE